MARENLVSFLKARSAEIIDAKNIQKILRARKSLRIKLGVDPTTPDLHLGHVVPLRVLKAFQDAGHQAVLIIGDFTSQIGDPSGKPNTRRQLTPGEPRANERTYRAQVGKILDLRRTEIRHNSEWFGNMRLADFLELLTHFSLPDVWKRQDFQQRLSSGKRVALHEAMYSVLQAYDSVAVRANIEIGGLDQRLNLLAGRQLQATLGRVAQDIILLPYLLGLDGKQKMSKSVGNTINLGDSAPEMFGKTMSTPDGLITSYAQFAAWLPEPDVAAVRRRLSGHENPRDVKLDVAEAIVKLYHGVDAARRARADFLDTFSRRAVFASAAAVHLRPGAWRPLALIAALGAVASRSQARRLVAGRAVEVDGRVVREPNAPIRVHSGSIIRIGKKQFFRVR